MPTEGSTLAIVKSVFYKTCFCIGLGTASYYSYGQVQNWVAAPTAAVSQVSGLQAKVDALSSPSSDITSVSLSDSPSAPAQAPVENTVSGYRANTRLYLIGGKKTAHVAPVAAAAVDPNASPSPAATAVTDKDKKEGDAKDGEKKEGEVAKTEEGVIPAGAPSAAGAGPVNALGLPIAQAPVEAAAPGAQAANANNGGVATPQAASNLPSGGVGSSLTNALDTLSGNSGTTAAATTGASESTGGSTTTSTTTISSSTASSTTLSATDITQLTGAAIKASFADQTESVSGLVCVLGQDQTTATDCSTSSHYSVHTDRWNTAYGLSSNATFSVASTTGTGQIKVNVDLNIEDVNQNFQTIALTVSPSEVASSVESKNGKSYKVYTLTLPDLTVMNEKLTSVVATLVYEDSTNGTGTMSTDSAMSFTRTHVETTSSNWDLTGQNRAPAANEQVIVATSMNYTMNLASQ